MSTQPGCDHPSASSDGKGGTDSGKSTGPSYGVSYPENSLLASMA